MASGVEEVDGSVGDARVAGTGEGFADGLADDLALGVGGSKGNREEWREGLDKGSGCEVRLVGGDGMEGGTEGHLLVQGRGAEGWKLGKGDGDGEVPTGEGNRFGAKGDGEGIRGVLGHGDGGWGAERRERAVSEKGDGGGKREIAELCGNSTRCNKKLKLGGLGRVCSGKGPLEMAGKLVQWVGRNQCCKGGAAGRGRQGQAGRKAITFRQHDRLE
eukprot:scaffold7989_cov214-Amphora_coffeaeformis.AAC.2